MPRLKASGKPRDPIYTQARWGPKRGSPEPPNVRTGGRIKKAKTIFDPSETPAKGALGTATPEPASEKRAEKRRMSVASQSSHTSRRTSISVSTAAAAAASPAPPSTPPSIGKRRRVDSSAGAASKKPQPPPTTGTNRSKEAPPPVADVVSTPPPPASPKTKQISLLLNSISGGSPSKEANGSKEPETTTATGNKRFPKRHQCSVCWNYGDRNLPGWLKCNGCTAMVHKSCIESWPAEKLGPWLCAQCHVCFECEEEVTQDELDCVHCSACYIAYHYACLPEKEVPPSMEAKEEWTCKHCGPASAKKEKLKGEEEEQEEEEEEEEEEPLNEVEILPMPEKEEVAVMAKGVGRGKKRRTKKEEKTGKGKAIKVDESVPDASKWTARDVYDFFVASFPKEASVFQEQEIDGVSLLLMRRSDVIQGLGFKLGPALRIYKQIIMLQTRDTDPTLTWY